MWPLQALAVCTAFLVLGVLGLSLDVQGLPVAESFFMSSLLNLFLPLKTGIYWEEEHMARWLWACVCARMRVYTNTHTTRTHAPQSLILS